MAYLPPRRRRGKMHDGETHRHTQTHTYTHTYTHIHTHSGQPLTVRRRAFLARLQRTFTTD